MRIIKFKAERHIDDAEVVWQRLRRVEDIPKYWGGHRRVEVLDAKPGLYKLKITFAFPGPLNVGYAEATIDEARREVLLKYLRGPFTGVVKNQVLDGALKSEWEVEIHPLFLPLKPWVVKHFKEGAQRALERLATGEQLTPQPA